MSVEYITIEDLIDAYRKAKVDAFYENGHLTAIDFAEYETNLFSNLLELEKKINYDDFQIFGGKDFTGSHLLALKKINFKETKKDTKIPFAYFSNSEHSWKSKTINDVDYRILGIHSVDFHVLSSLWIEKVGYEMEKKVSTNSYGCRLRSFSNGKFSDEEEERFSKNRHGHFKSYLPAYQKWQQNGLKNITTALESEKKVIAITADLKKFYHRIDCSFILNDEFLSFIDYTLNKQQQKLSKLLQIAIEGWSKRVCADEDVPDQFKYAGHCGIPMGLGASKTIANLLLCYLDRQIEQEIKPLYYGRYVDDIFLVIENNDNICDSEDFWNYLKKRIENLEVSIGAKEKTKSKEREYSPEGYLLKIPYSENSLIEFGRGKEKYFFLEGISGSTFISTLKESLEENSSEWNLPPDIEHDTESFTKEVSKASLDNLEAINGLRKSDGLSIQRMKFILYLKRLEIVVKFFPKLKWEDKVNSFFDLCLEHALTPEAITVYSKYYPRIISLAVEINDTDFIIKFQKKVNETFNFISFSEQVLNKEPIWSAKNYIQRCIEEAVYCSLNPLKKDMFKLELISTLFISKEQSFEEIWQVVQKLVVTDLHKKPFKDYFVFPEEDFPEFLLLHNITDLHEELFRSNYLVDYNFYKNGCHRIINEAYKLNRTSTDTPFAFYFFTRHFSLFELSVVFPSWYKGEEFEIFRDICRLFKIDSTGLNVEFKPKMKLSKEIKTICVDTDINSLNRTIAFTSLETKTESWVAVVQDRGFDPDTNRVERIFSLIDDILRCKKVKINYVLFPELSIPRELLVYISAMFLKKGISIIAGVEYENTTKAQEPLPPQSKKYVSNQLYFILTVNGKWGPSHIVLKQEKVIPALKEGLDLASVGGAILRAENQNKFLINHSGFWFAGLICNDFLDINNRAIFRGFIDALIVVEWNMDIKTYNALVESSATDLHAFILQVNNRLYGDTRLRVPYKESYMRDQVRVRGGELDYFVVSTLKVDDLREFQSYNLSPEKPFKPVPTGYEMSVERRMGYFYYLEKVKSEVKS